MTYRFNTRFSILLSRYCAVSHVECKPVKRCDKYGGMKACVERLNNLISTPQSLLLWLGGYKSKGTTSLVQTCFLRLWAPVVSAQPPQACLLCENGLCVGLRIEIYQVTL